MSTQIIHSRPVKRPTPRSGATRRTAGCARCRGQPDQQLEAKGESRALGCRAGALSAGAFRLRAENAWLLRTLAAYVEALGGRLEIIADFGGQRLAFTEPGIEAAWPHSAACRVCSWPAGPQFQVAATEIQETGAFIR
jgi:hypothetical protein